MREETCFFTGHRKVPECDVEKMREVLSSYIKKLVERGYRTFVTGGAVGFDTIAAETVLEMKKKYPFIRLAVIIPCENQSAKWSFEQKERYNTILSLADETKCLSPVYYDGCMQVRNRAMADMSSVCIAYLTSSFGGTKSTVDYCERIGIPVINIVRKR